MYIAKLEFNMELIKKNDLFKFIIQILSKSFYFFFLKLKNIIYIIYYIIMAYEYLDT